MYNAYTTMLNRISMSAPGKINIHLRVLEKRTDGYHAIESVFQLISFADELSVSIEGNTGSCRVESPLMDLPEVNTITRAIAEYRIVTGIQSGILVEVLKHIPAGAGLGGGSSDAAAVLKSLDALFDTQLTLPQMAGMASKIGSDVPFFLSGPAAVVQGRGELVKPMVSRTGLFGVLVWPDVHSSTAEAYRLVDGWHAEGKDSSLVWPNVESLENIYRGPVSGWTFRNSFTAPIEAAYPVIGEVKRALARCGARFVEMSGSGSSVFGLFEDKKEADAAQIVLSRRWQHCVSFLLLAS